MEVLYKKKSKRKRGVKYRRPKSSNQISRDFEDKMNRRGTAYSTDRIPYINL